MKRVSAVLLLLFGVAASAQDSEIEQAIQNLGDRNRRVRKKAEKTILEAGTRPVLELLVKKGLKNPNLNVRKAARELMPKLVAVIFFPPHLEKEVIEALPLKASRRVRIVKLKGLMRTAGPSGWRFYELLLEDPDPVVRAAAARALVPKPGSEARPTPRNPAYFSYVMRGLRQAARSRDPDKETLGVIETLAQVAWTLAKPESLEEFEPLLGHTDPRVRRVMAKTLGSYAGPADAVWTRLVDDEDLTVVHAARAVVAEVSFEALPAAVSGMLSSASIEQRFGAAEQAARHGNVKGMATLRGLLPGEMKEAARAVLTELKSPVSDVFFAEHAAAIRPLADVGLLHRLGDEESRQAALERVRVSTHYLPMRPEIADWLVTREDVRSLLQADPERRLSFVLGACREKRDVVREETLEFLKQSKPDAPGAAEAFNTLTRQASVVGVHPDLEPLVLKTLENETHTAFAAAAELAVLGRMRSALEPLRRAAWDPGLESFHVASFALARIGTMDDHFRIIEGMSKVGPRGQVERLSMIVAGRYDENDRVMRTRLLKHRPVELSEPLRSAYAILLSRTATGAETARLRPYLTSERPSVRRMALAGLARLGDGASFRRAKVMFREGKLQGSVGLIADLNPAAAEEWLLKFLKDPDPRRRAEAAAALARQGSENAKLLVRNMARTEPWTFDRQGRTVLDAYVRLFGPEAKALLIELVERGALPPGARRHVVALAIDEVVTGIMERGPGGHLDLIDAVVHRKFYARHAKPVDWKGGGAAAFAETVKAGFDVPLVIEAEVGLSPPPAGRYPSLEALLRATGASVRVEGEAVHLSSRESAIRAWEQWWSERGEHYP